jgi:hypothetical protein
MEPAYNRASVYDTLTDFVEKKTLAGFRKPLVYFESGF